VWNRQTGAVSHILTHTSRIRSLHYHCGRLATGTCDATRNILGASKPSVHA